MSVRQSPGTLRDLTTGLRDLLHFSHSRTPGKSLDRLIPCSTGPPAMSATYNRCVCKMSRAVDESKFAACC
jgi:hypothetical protein